MLVIRILFVAFSVTCGVSGFAQGVFSAIKSGDWSDPTVWNLDSGSDADGIPDADDDAAIIDYTIYVTDSQESKNLLLASETINVRIWIDGGDLTINQNFTIANSTTISRSAWLTIRSGNLTVLSNVMHTNTNYNPYGGLQFDNRAPYEGLDRTVTIGGNLTSSYSLHFNFWVLGTTTNAVTLKLNAGSTQYINGERLSSFRNYSKIKVSNGTELRFWANTNAPLINDSLLIANGSIYLDRVGLDLVNEFEHQIAVASGSKITVEDDIPFPDHLDKNAIGFVTDMQAGSISDFNVGGSFDVNVITEDFNYRNVILRGNGSKTITNDINGAGASVNDLSIENGVVTIDASVTDISGITGTITVKDGATLRIMGNPSMPAAGQFVLEEGSTVEYGSSAAQSVLGGLDYWNLAFSGTGTKSTTAALTFQGEMSFGVDVSTLEIDHDITIQSDVNNTGFVSEIPTGYTLDYSGGGEFICERYFVSTPRDNNNASENYRDFSLPLISTDATLSQFDDDNPFPYTYSGGKFTNLVELPIFGVADSKYPGGSSSNVSDFNSTSGAFGTPGSYNNSIVQTSGGKITSNAVRFGWGDEDGLTILAKGEINYGDQVFNAQKSLFGKDYNLYGNPYPCAIDFEEIVNNNANFVTSGNGIIPTFYVIGPDEFGANNTGFYNAITNTGTVAKEIPAYQGFFLQVNGATANYDFTISENMKAAEDKNTYKSDMEIAPELMTIQVRENGLTKDQIHFYFFEGGTNGFEKMLDVEKLEPKVTALTGAKLDFYDGKKKMNLLANALNQNKELNVQFVVENPDANSIELELANLSSLLDIYNCVYIENLVTGETYTAEGNFINIPLGNVTNETFIIKSISAPDLFEVNSSDATCHGFEDGLLRVDMSNLPKNSTVYLYKGNILWESFSSSNSVYKRNVGAGDYEFRIPGITESCTYVYRETIEDEEEVIAEFTISDSLEAGKEVIFTSTSTGSTVNEWLNSLGETTYGNTLSMTYENAGRYWVKLTAIGNYETCNDEELKFFEILPAESGVGIEDNPFEDISIATLNKTVEVRGLPNGSTIELLSSEGKLIKSIDEKNGIAIFANLKGADYLIRISNNNKSVTHHIGLQ